ncbi:hypothetical protein RclHR1_09180006 [Rhizophagus clarus]|uniref:Uncharacterized protein n=1 Tax=Rhizophagus clarus TaxID=94130 RepID=A0A2Z6SHY0_9GLOM|nr:hypothetical protein RclHR1_09180006 [Rhizophagus clarus]GET04106.1 hypothetical protein GLOIN_2v1884028 [Rhizophagus clarus]
MENNPQNNYFDESNNSQQSTAAVIQPGNENSNINYNAINADFSMANDNITFPPHTNINHFSQRLTSNISTSQSYAPPIISSCSPQYDHPSQPISPLSSFNMTTINPSQSEILSFDIPGFKIIVIPTFSQQDNTYINTSSNIMGNQFTQFHQ